MSWIRKTKRATYGSAITRTAQLTTTDRYVFVLAVIFVVAFVVFAFAAAFVVVFFCCC